VRGVEHAVTAVARVAREVEAERLVVGMPLRMDGGRGAAAEAAQAFADRLREQCGLPVETYDERLTSALSERRLRETGVRTGHAKERVDQGAAMALLESYLAHRSARRARGETL
jgi:putative Holliday junction resolvase